VSVYKDMRDKLKADLEIIDGVQVFSSWPKQIVPPCIYVMPPLGDIYMTAGDTFRQYVVHTDVAILTDHADVDESLELLESLIEAVIRNSMDYSFGGVEPPSPMTVTEGGADYLGAVVHLSKPVILPEV
jgi:hypothetical protein